MIEQGAGVDRKVALGLHAEPQPPAGPGIGERHDPDRHRLAAARRRRVRDDRDADAAFDHAAERIEARQPHPQAQRRPGAGGMAVEMLLQGAAGGQADEVVRQRVLERDLPLAGERMLERRHQDQPVLGEGKGLQLGGRIDGVGDDADLRPAARHAAHDLGARPLLDLDIDLG